jgi:hypothetical protein
MIMGGYMVQPVSQKVTEMIQFFENEKLIPSNQFFFNESQATITQYIKDFLDKGLNPQETKEIKKFLNERVEKINQSDLDPSVKDSMSKVIDQLKSLLPKETQKKELPTDKKMSKVREYAMEGQEGSRASKKNIQELTTVQIHQMKTDPLQKTANRIISEAAEMRVQAKIKEANLFFTRAVQMVKKNDRAGALKNFEAAAFLDHPTALRILGAHHLNEAIQLEKEIQRDFKGLSEANPDYTNQELVKKLEGKKMDAMKSRALAQKQLSASANAGIEEAQALLKKYFPQLKMDDMD